MTNQTKRLLTGMVILGLATITCNMPTNVTAPELSDQAIADTAVARALAAQAGGAPTAAVAAPAASNTPAPIPTQCSPTVKATTDANVRGGPGTAYDIVGYLPTGGEAPVAGRNDTNTWWYIHFAGADTGYAWIAGSVVTSSCLPSVVQVVAAPALPTAKPTETEESVVQLYQFVPMFEAVIPAAGDIQLQDVFLSTGGEVIARVAVSPGGSLTGNVTYKVWVDGDLKATKSEGLPHGSMAYWSGVNVSGTHDVRVKVDAGNSFSESDEGNNEWQGSLTH